MKPWEMEFNGRRWCDMPGSNDDDRKLNFFLYRRGKLDVEEAIVEAEVSEDYRDEKDGAAKLPRLVLVAQKRFGKMGTRKTVRAVEAQEAIEARMERERARAALNERRARLKRRLLQHHAVYGAQRQISLRAGLDETCVYRFIQEDKGLTALTKVERLEQALDDLDAGRWRIVPRAGSHHERPRKCPEGYEPYPVWLEREAAKRGTRPHSLRVYLDRNPELRPPLLKQGTRSWFVKKVANVECRMTNDECGRRAA